MTILDRKHAKELNGRDEKVYTVQMELVEERRRSEALAKDVISLGKSLQEANARFVIIIV